MSLPECFGNHDPRSQKCSNCHYEKICKIPCPECRRTTFLAIKEKKAPAGYLYQCPECGKVGPYTHVFGAKEKLEIHYCYYCGHVHYSQNLTTKQ